MDNIDEIYKKKVNPPQYLELESPYKLDIMNVYPPLKVLFLKCFEFIPNFRPTLEDIMKNKCLNITKENALSPI